MIKRRLALLALEGVLLLTACGQTKDVSTLTTPPLQSTAQVIAPVEDKAEMPQKEEKTEESADALLPVERVDTPTDAEAEKNPAPAETAPPTAPKAPATPAPKPAPKPAASGNIYSIAEAVRAGNEYARAQYGVTIDTSMTTANSSFFPGTADSVAWLAENGGQAALTAAVKGNVDATFACLAAMDGAETVSAYARFNCTARYDAASDEYIVVVLYG